APAKDLFMYNELELTIPSISSELKKSPISDPERRKFLRNYARNKGMIAHLNPFQTFLEILGLLNPSGWLATDYGRKSVDVNTKSVKRPKIGNNRDRNNNSISKAVSKKTSNLGSVLNLRSLNQHQPKVYLKWKQHLHKRDGTPEKLDGQHRPE
ncbi:hypothetical protein BB560_006911, partial [Smittium megazygosporum]